MTSTHTITATRSGSTEREDLDVEYVVRFTFHPESRPSFYDPGSGPFAEFLSATHDDGGPLDELEADWCEEWLTKHQDEAVAAALHDREVARDYAADLWERVRAEDRQMGGL